jgi:hypothetical protein
VTAHQPPLFLPGWDLEPCADAARDAERERAFLDLHGPQPVRRRLTKRELKWLGDFETVHVVGEVL